MLVVPKVARIAAQAALSAAPVSRSMRKMKKNFDYTWFWKPNAMRPIDRKGQLCRVLARGAMNSVLVEFTDGFKVITSRFAIRRFHGQNLF